MIHSRIDLELEEFPAIDDATVIDHWCPLGLLPPSADEEPTQPFVVLWADEPPAVFERTLVGYPDVLRQPFSRRVR